MNAETLMLVGGSAAFLLTIYWVRSRELREKYAIVWITVAALLLLCGLFPRIIMGLADTFHLSYSAAVLFMALGVMYVFSFTISVSLTRQYRRNTKLVQQMSLLEQRLRSLEAAAGATARARSLAISGGEPEHA